MIINEAILKLKKEEYINLIPEIKFIELPLDMKTTRYLRHVLKKQTNNEEENVYILGVLVKKSNNYYLKAEFTLFGKAKIARIFKIFSDIDIDMYEVNEELGKKYLNKKLIIDFDIKKDIKREVKNLNDLIYLNLDDITVVEDCTEFYKNCNDEDFDENSLILFNQNAPLKFEEFITLSNELKYLKISNEKAREDNKNLIKQINDKKEDLSKLEQKEERIKEIINNCKQEEKNFSNLFIKTSENAILDREILNANLQESIEHIKNYISYNYKHSFNDDLILNMLLGIYSNQIVVLAGAPGSGKTSFAKYFADAVGKYEIVSVQANWMDRSDLLGYYNPIDKSFQASVFLEKLVKLIDMAKLNKDVFYFIILDEMNLSTVEYYFADFLSAWNAQIDEEIKIELYSKSILNEDGDGIDKIIKRTGEKYGVRETDISKIINELEKILNENNAADKKELSDIIIKCKKIKKYPWKLVIPKNLKFIATINKDATTKDLSPKVIDRSYFIRMEMTDKLDDNKKDDNKKVEEVDEKYLKYSAGEIESQGLAHEEYLKILDIKKRANEYKLRINNRFDVAVKNIINYLDNDEINQEIINSAKLKNFLIAALVLPKISMKKSQIEDFLENILQNDEDRFLENIINNMKSDDDDEVTYWRE